MLINEGAFSVFSTLEQKDAPSEQTLMGWRGTSIYSRWKLLKLRTIDNCCTKEKPLKSIHKKLRVSKVRKRLWGIGIIDTLPSKWQNRHRMFLLLFDSILRLLKTDVERSCQSWQAILKVDIINGNSWHMFRKSWQKMESSHQLNSNQGRSQGQEEM